MKVGVLVFRGVTAKPVVALFMLILTTGVRVETLKAVAQLAPPSVVRMI